MAIDTSHRYANVASTTAAIAAIAALLKSGKVQAVEGLPPELMELIIAMAGDLNSILQFLNEFHLEQQALITTVIPRYRSVNNARVDLPGPGAFVRFPPMVIPAGVQLKIKAGWNNGGLAYIANSGAAAMNPYAAETLIANEFTYYSIHDAENLYGSSTVAGEYVILTVEGE